jgi:hypothetical protein
VVAAAGWHAAIAASIATIRRELVADRTGRGAKSIRHGLLMNPDSNSYSSQVTREPHGFGGTATRAPADPSALARLDSVMAFGRRAPQSIGSRELGAGDSMSRRRGGRTARCRVRRQGRCAASTEGWERRPGSVVSRVRRFPMERAASIESRRCPKRNVVRSGRTVRGMRRGERPSR